MSSVQQMMDYTFVSKYARWNRVEQRRETWKEAVNRVRKMMLKHYSDKDIEDDINWAYDMMLKKKVLGSQRALQFGGKPMLSKNARGYNCVSSYCDRLRFFQEYFWLLLCGCGAGFSVQKHHIKKLPAFKERNCNKVKTFTIPDDIEGWSDSIGILLTNWFGVQKGMEEFAEYAPDKCGILNFNYSQIRPKGASLSSGVGKAPGPEGLKNALNKITILLDERYNTKQSRLKPIDAYDVAMHIADAVLSGGIRRSATIALFSPDDAEMASAKTGDWIKTNPQRGRSNNSAMLLRDSTTKEQFSDLMKNVEQFGEPGFVWCDDLEALVNPCITKDSVITTEEGLYSVDSLRNRINKEYTALVDGSPYSSTGFWKTGTKPVYEVEFSSGRILKATGNHKIKNSDEEWKELKDFKIGEKVKVHNQREHTRHIDYNGKDYAQGYCLGSFVGDGNISKDSAQLKWWGEDKDQQKKDGAKLLQVAGFRSKNLKTGSDSKSINSVLNSIELYRFADSLGIIKNDKHLTEESISNNWSFLSGLVSGYFDADGHVIFNPIKGSCIRLTSNSLSNLRLMQHVLHSFGIESKIYQERCPEGYRILPDGNGGHQEYWCKATHDLHVSCDSIIWFKQYIKLRHTKKQALIDKIIGSYKRKPNKTNFEDKIVSINQGNIEDVYDCSVNNIQAFDANGIYVHNCVEIQFWAYDNKGNSGWQMCNLSTINASSIKDIEDFEERGKAASIIGTLQAGFTNFEYLGPVSEYICRREALLGVSMTGIMEKSEIVLDPENQRKVAKIIKKVNKEFAEKIGINQAARTTCLKPEGTTSTILGTSSGIHPHHAKRYLRRIQANTTEVPYQHFKKFNDKACEKSVWSANDTDDVVIFPIEVPDGSKLKNQLPAEELLEIVKNTQQNWVAAGTNKSLCTQPWLMHNVSNTITVKEDEWDAVCKYIYKNRKYFCGISLIPASGDKDYPQAPFTAVLTSREIVREYGEAAIWCSGIIELALQAFDKDVWKACDFALNDRWKETFDGNGMVSVKALHKLTSDKAKQLHFLERFQNFSFKYFDGDHKKLSYCLKDVCNWKVYCDLADTLQDVDYTTMIETEDNTKPEEEISCSGGACTI